MNTKKEDRKHLTILLSPKVKEALDLIVSKESVRIKQRLSVTQYVEELILKDLKEKGEKIE